MRITLNQLAELTGGELVGDGWAQVVGVNTLDAAGPGEAAFARKDSLQAVPSCRAEVVFVPERAEGPANQIVVEDPHLAFIELLRLVEAELRPRPEGVHERAAVDPSARLGEDVAVGAGACIGPRTEIGARTVVHPNATVGADCRLGADCEVHPGAVLRERVLVGSRTVIHANSTVGGDGFGYVLSRGRRVKAPQVGRVVIGDDVEVGCNTTVDRGAVGDTVVEDGVKMDNHCHVAHNCRIGAGSVLVGYARMGGSTVLGKNCVLAEDAAVSDHITLGDGCIVTATARVAKSWPAGSVLGGAPAMPFDQAKRVIMAQRRLPKIMRQITEIRAKLGLSD